ncbi:MAG: hypothetical protein JEY96_20040 [Bacteroidales bacterium]|nr:hypothetical protein [Bacteroidales bacterium]
MKEEFETFTTKFTKYEKGTALMIPLLILVIILILAYIFTGIEKIYVYGILFAGFVFLIDRVREHGKEKVKVERIEEFKLNDNRIALNDTEYLKDKIKSLKLTLNNYQGQIKWRHMYSIEKKVGVENMVKFIVDNVEYEKTIYLKSRNHYYHLKHILKDWDCEIIDNIEKFMV